jgi:hypothetical protein
MGFGGKGKLYAGILVAAFLVIAAALAYGKAGGTVTHQQNPVAQAGSAAGGSPDTVNQSAAQLTGHATTTAATTTSATVTPITSASPTTTPTTSVASNEFGSPLQPHTVSVYATAVTPIQHESSKYVNFTVPAGSFNSTVTGSYETNGSSVEFGIFNHSAYEYLINTGNFLCAKDMGIYGCSYNLTQEIDVQLPPGSYTMVFMNPSIAYNSSSRAIDNIIITNAIAIKYYSYS